MTADELPAEPRPTTLLQAHFQATDEGVQTIGREAMEAVHRPGLDRQAEQRELRIVDDSVKVEWFEMPFDPCYPQGKNPYRWGCTISVLAYPLTARALAEIEAEPEPFFGRLG